MGFAAKLSSIGALLLLASLARCANEIAEGTTNSGPEIGDDRASTFLNFGLKVNGGGDQRYDRHKTPDDADRALKSKADVLSRFLKMHIDRLRNKTDQVELVFLVDASGSVGAENFRSELDFVTKLLSDFTVDATAARVAVVTFGGRGSVRRDVDQISGRETSDHKCRLLNKLSANITYTGGGTYTRGALLEALAILEKGRGTANKVVFLITDGFSNGGDPRPAANLLKNAGATVFTFGIRTGNVEELHDVASTPGYTHSYLLDSFAEFEALARRALHRDLKTGRYAPVTLPTDCNGLCEADAANRTCCDDLATCACGTATGHYACICPSGYFGSGLRGFCQSCPNGTYASGNASTGDSTSVCAPCPDVNHITIKVPATTIVDCVCGSGFTADGAKCEAIMCPKLKVPENGYLVEASACSNVVHAACGIRCTIGFHLTGDSIRLCEKDGAWSGNEPQCLLKTCPVLRAPLHGSVKCEHDEDQHQFDEDSTVYPIDTRCQFNCDVGYQLRGSKVRNCLPVSRWDGLKVTCKAVKCEPLPQVGNGDVAPEICVGPAKIPFATNCTTTCHKGFVLEGPTSRSCSGRTGIWTQRHIVNRCVDKTPPVIKCPADVVTETAAGRNYARVNWTTPLATDNVDSPPPTVWTKPHVVLPWRMKIGTRMVVYVAQDASGNRARCKFKVKVLDREPPTIENCVDPPIFYTDRDDGHDNVTWDEPVFYDNSRATVLVDQSHRPGEDLFSFGRTRVYYNATDKYGNRASCVLNVTVKDVCENLTAPVNGRINCSASTTDDRETRCVVACEDGYDFAEPTPAKFNAVNDRELLLKCNTGNRTWEDNELPECSETQIPKISQEGGVILQGDESMCDNQTILRDLNDRITGDLKSKLLDVCDNDVECDLINLDPVCEDDLSSSKSLDGDSRSRRRRRRDRSRYARDDGMASPIERASESSLEYPGRDDATRLKRRRDRIEIKFRFIGRIIEENFENPKRGVQMLRDKIEALTRAGKLDLLNARTNQELGRLALNLHFVFKEPRDLCEPGSVLRRHGCVKCPAGTFYESSARICQLCPFGQYQNATGSLRCRPCPEYTFTKRMHAKSVNDCIPVCRPGYYSRRKRYHGSRVATEPCFACDVGFYQPSYGQTQCSPCPLNTTTERRGSTDIGDCLPIYKDTDCRTESCLNGGRCLQDEDGFFCECRDYYVGSRCDEFKSPCDSSPCLNEGVCKIQTYPNDAVTYECACKTSYTGANCEIYVDECSTDPCQNEGRCVSTENDFTCDCKDGFEGQFCEIPMDYCEFTPCEEGSTCRTVNGTWRCLCKPGFLGRHCNLLPCDWLPCHANAICVNVREENATRRSYRCVCPDGYTGADCTVRIGHCESAPCSNGGSCVNHLRNYTCNCPVPFAGRNCETELSSDYVLHFTKSGTTDYVIMRGPERNLTQLTVCLWLRSMDTFNYGTVLSYATNFHDNAFTLTDYNGFVLYVNGEKVVTDIKVNDGYWHFLCASWESEDGTWRMFVDGVLKDSGVRLAQRSAVAADGVLVVGQEQDRPGGGFAESEAFLGMLGLLDVWDVTLNEYEIARLWSGCERRHGNVVAWEQLRQHVHGDVAILASPFCRGCPLPVAPYRGNVNASEDHTVVTYYCDNGYVVRLGAEERRSVERKCLKHGQWEGRVAPICTKVRCGFPGYFPRGHIQGESYSYGDEIHYTCASGYELRGNPHRICNSDGKWIGPSPICIGITCKNLLAPENGDIEYLLEENERDDLTILQAGQQLEFKCNPGYRLTGERYLTCLETGVWDHERPSCAPYGCPPPKEIEHAHVVIPRSNEPTRTGDPEENAIDDPTGRTYDRDDVVGFACRRGYEFRGSSLTEFELRCSGNGTWTGFVPDCVPRHCTRPERPRHANIFLRERGNVTVEIPAVEADADADAIARSDGRIAAKSGRSSSSPVTFVPGAEVVVVCDPGYELIGDEVRACTEEKGWSSSAAFCAPRNCSDGDHPILKLLRESKSETDFGDDRWAVSLDGERRDAENILGVYKSFEILVEGRGYGQRVILTCRDNARMKLNESSAYRTISNVTWTCDETAKWRISDSSLGPFTSEELFEDSLLICDRSCAAPRIPEHGYIDNSNDTDDIDKRKITGSVIAFKCRHGYVLEGNEESTCLSNGTWTAFPSCRPVTCGKPPSLANAILKTDIYGTKNFTFGNMVSYQCISGYRMFGQASLRCLGNGKWSRTNGRCSKISCGKPQIQQGIALYGRSYLFQDQLTYACPDGKKHGTITCQNDGKWNELPKC